tara:strand:+ start:176 stop:571 length:396 start_codon:yes stop_codon:yes gene_type:complete
LSKTFHLEIITPTNIYTEKNVSYVRADSLEGQIGIMAKHTQATIALGIGEIKVVINGKKYYYATSGGYADIQPEGVLLLLETAEKYTDIDVNRAEDSQKRAKLRISDKTTDQVRARTSIAKANNRLKISKR